MPDGLLTALAGIVGPVHVITDSDATAGWATDWTGTFSSRPCAVVRPADTAQVAALLRVCADAGVSVTPQGGNTGLVGGSIPVDGHVLLSLRRLDSIRIEAGHRSATVGAGATLAAVQHAAAPFKVSVGVDLASRESATIGGMVATNAGGINVVANGSMRQQVIGLQAVTADGAVIGRVPAPSKDATGPDLAHALLGSEGTLAVITAVHLRLVPVPAATTTVLIGLPDIDSALAHLGALRELPQAARLLAVEFMQADGVGLVSAQHHTAPPLDPVPPVMVLAEVSGDLSADSLIDLIGDRPATVATTPSDRRALWSWREGHTDALAACGRPVTKLDVTVPLPRMAAFIDWLSEHGLEAVTFGHLAEGNLHVNLLDASSAEGDRVLGQVAAIGGSIASEHGIGRTKAHLLHLTRSSEEQALMRRVKAAWDPHGRLNPGVILP